MPSTYSNLKIQLMATGENTGTWGNVTNENLGTALEQAIVETATVTFASANVTLTLTDSNAKQDARALRLNLTGTTGGARDLIVPAIQKPYIVNNGTADTITVKVSGQTGVAVPAGSSMLLYNNGTDVIVAFNRVVADVVGNVTGNVSGSAGSAATLQTARNIGISGGATAANVSFDGSAAVDLNITALNASVISTGTLGVANGGTGATTLNSEAVVIGNSTGAVKFVDPGTSGNVLTSNGTAWASQAISAGGDYIMQAYTSPATWTKPAGLKAIKVTVVGGGGAGGAAGPSPNDRSTSGGGGGGGGAAILYLDAPAVPGPISVTVGGAGGTSSFGPLASATGGSTGSSGTNQQTGVAGGAGGLGSSGTINLGGGGGGGGFQFLAPTDNVSGTVSGAGGSSILGGGGAAVGRGTGDSPTPGATAGNAGQNYGGGGSGGVRQRIPAPTLGPGGAGAGGVVIVEEFY